MKVTIVVILGFFVFANANSIANRVNHEHNKIIVNNVYAFGSEETANCWSQTKTEQGSSVLRCIECKYKDNSTGIGMHDGQCSTGGGDDNP